MEKPKNNIVNAHNSILEKYDSHKSHKNQATNKNGILSKLRSISILTAAMVLTAAYSPVLLIGHTTQLVAHKFAIALDRRSIIVVTLAAAASWGALTVLTYFQLALADVLAVGVASIVAVVATGFAAVTSKMGGRLTSVVFAYPLAITALFFPPLVAALVTPSLEPYVLEPSYALAAWILDTVFAVGGLNEVIRGAFNLETFGAGVGLPGIGYLVMWIGISIPIGWFLGTSRVIVDNSDRADV